MTKFKVVLIFPVLIFITQYCFSQVSTVAFEEYETSKWLDLSFEGKFQNHMQELQSLNSFFKQDAVPTRDLLMEYSNIIISLFPDVVTQKANMDLQGLTCDNLRLCEDELYYMSENERNSYFEKLDLITGLYALSEDEINMIQDVLQYISLSASLELQVELDRLWRYFFSTPCVDYTKLEMFRDFTGYCSPIEFQLHYISDFDNFYNPLLFLREKQGLAGEEAITRLRDLDECVCDSPLYENLRLNPENDFLNLFTAYPNPIQKETTIAVGNLKDSKVSVVVFDINGRMINTIYNGELRKGVYFFDWAGLDQNGERVSEGIYFCKMQSLQTEKVLKLIVVND